MCFLAFSTKVFGCKNNNWVHIADVYTPLLAKIVDNCLNKSGINRLNLNYGDGQFTCVIW